MKITLISPNRNHLDAMHGVLAAQGHAVTLVEGGKSRMRAAAEQAPPDLMLVDGMCSDPGELALVEQVTVHHPQIAVILLCASQTPEFLLHAMRAGVREVLPSPPAPAALEAAVERLAARRAGQAGRDSAQVVAFMPCKGGSGATFIATNLGWQLAQTRSVLLIDLNLQFGDAASYVSDARPAATLADLARDIGRLDASLLAASALKVAPGFGILAAPAEPTQATEVKAEHIDVILNLAAASYDFVLLDLGLNLQTVAIRALDRAHRIHPVLQPGLPHLRNAGKLAGVFRSLGYPPQRIAPILNRLGRTDEIGLAEIRRALGTGKLLTLPDAPKEVEASINHGVPLAQSARHHPVVRALADIAGTLSPPDAPASSLLGRLFRRA